MEEEPINNAKKESLAILKSTHFIILPSTNAMKSMTLSAANQHSIGAINLKQMILKPMALMNQTGIKESAQLHAYVGLECAHE